MTDDPRRPHVVDSRDRPVGDRQVVVELTLIEEAERAAFVCAVPRDHLVLRALEVAVRLDRPRADADCSDGRDRFDGLERESPAGVAGAQDPRPGGWLTAEAKQASRTPTRWLASVCRMRRLGQVVVVLVAFGLFGGALYLQQQDATIDCAGASLTVYGASAGTQLRGQPVLSSVPQSCDRDRAAAESRDHLELAAVGAVGLLALRRPRSTA